MARFETPSEAQNASNMRYDTVMNQTGDYSPLNALTRT